MTKGRPTKMTAEVVARLAAAIALGLTDEEAAALCDIDDRTLTRWRKKPEFCRAVQKATATRTAKRINRIEEGKSGWQGTAWALERLHGQRFAPPKSTAAVEHSGSVGMVLTAGLAGEIAAARSARPIQTTPTPALTEPEVIAE